MRWAMSRSRSTAGRIPGPCTLTTTSEPDRVVRRVPVRPRRRREVHGRSRRRSHRPGRRARPPEQPRGLPTAPAGRGPEGCSARRHLRREQVPTRRQDLSQLDEGDAPGVEGLAERPADLPVPAGAVVASAGVAQERPQAVTHGDADDLPVPPGPGQPGTQPAPHTNGGGSEPSGKRPRSPPERPSRPVPCRPSPAGRRTAPVRPRHGSARVVHSRRAGRAWIGQLTNSANTPAINSRTRPRRIPSRRCAARPNTSAVRNEIAATTGKARRSILVSLPRARADQRSVRVAFPVHVWRVSNACGSHEGLPTRHTSGSRGPARRSRCASTVTGRRR